MRNLLSDAIIVTLKNVIWKRVNHAFIEL